MRFYPNNPIIDIQIAQSFLFAFSLIANKQINLKRENKIEHYYEPHHAREESS